MRFTDYSFGSIRIDGVTYLNPAEKLAQGSHDRSFG
jgi:hypothetical protein